MSTPRYGDNIFAIMAVVNRTLLCAEWDKDEREAALSRITSTKSYEEAIAVCREYITIVE